MKVQDYTLPKTIPTEAKEMLDDIRRILNNGGYVPQTIAAVPAWAGDDGESVLQSNAGEIRNYWYDVATATWNYGLPLSTKYGWDYIEVDGAHSSAVKAVSFGYTFRTVPIVLTSFIGYTSSAPTSLVDFKTGMTKITVASYNSTDTSTTLTVYSGDGSNFPGVYYMGISWVAIG